jgi:hypothetical protein
MSDIEKIGDTFSKTADKLYDLLELEISNVHADGMREYVPVQEGRFLMTYHGELEKLKEQLQKVASLHAQWIYQDW